MTMFKGIISFTIVLSRSSKIKAVSRLIEILIETYETTLIEFHVQ